MNCLFKIFRINIYIGNSKKANKTKNHDIRLLFEKKLF
jgi:hypothetical protein